MLIIHCSYHLLHFSWIPCARIVHAFCDINLHEDRPYLLHQTVHMFSIVQKRYSTNDPCETFSERLVFGHPTGLNENRKNCFHSPLAGVNEKQFFCFQVACPFDFSLPTLIYQYCDKLYKMWQMNNRDCNKKSTVTYSACKKRSTVNGKSRL